MTCQPVDFLSIRVKIIDTYNRIEFSTCLLVILFWLRHAWGRYKLNNLFRCEFNKLWIIIDSLLAWRRKPSRHNYSRRDAFYDMSYINGLSSPGGYSFIARVPPNLFLGIFLLSPLFSATTLILQISLFGDSTDDNGRGPRFLLLVPLKSFAEESFQTISGRDHMTRRGSRLRPWRCAWKSFTTGR